MLGFILGITNPGRFQGLQVGAKEITIMGSLRDYKSGNKDYKSRQGVQIGTRDYKTGAGDYKWCRTVSNVHLSKP